MFAKQLLDGLVFKYASFKVLNFFKSAIAWTGISVRTLKRFPTERHLVESKLMTEEEYDLYMNIDAPHGKWYKIIIYQSFKVCSNYVDFKFDQITT